MCVPSLLLVGGGSDVVPGYALGTGVVIVLCSYCSNLSGKFEYRDYLLKKVKNVLLPYVLISIPIIAYRLYTNDVPGYILEAQPDFLTWGGAKKIGYFFLFGAHMQPLWFIPMIALFYVACAFIIYIERPQNGML